MITALFWHAIQTYTGSWALTQCIRAIWPSYLDIPNHLPESAGITTQGLLSQFIFWTIQFPILLTPPHKLKWFFIFKAVIVPIVSLATVITMVLKAGGSGDIWNQQYRVHGSARAWLTLSSMMSVAGGVSKPMLSHLFETHTNPLFVPFSGLPWPLMSPTLQDI